jgi:prophage tail gpP-like protein
MKTKLFIALLLISTITFAQVKKQQITKTESPSKAHYVKFGEIKGESNNNKKTARYVQLDDVKGESNDTSTKRTIKIGGIEKPYTRFKNENNQNSNRWWVNKKMKKAELKASSTQRSRGNVIVEDTKASNNNARRRVVVAKSNKQGNPNNN